MTYRTTGYLPIEEYAAIGDGGAFALVGSDGAIDWSCLPQLDSPSVFGAILDPERGGSYILRPTVAFETERHYVERTNVLQTVFHTDVGSVRVTEAFTIDPVRTGGWRELVRHVEGLSGTVPMAWTCFPRPAYGAAACQIDRVDDDVIVMRGPEVSLALRSFDAGGPRICGDAVEGDFAARDGMEATLVLVAGGADALPIPTRAAASRRLEETSAAWRFWVSGHSYSGPWDAAVERSLLAIKLLSDGRTGAIAAAGTSSLPEALQAERNYDYRFGWVRDLCFTLDALLAVGMDEQAHASVTWLLQATGHTHPRIDPVYALDGHVVRSQSQLALAGYRGTTPVHIGNEAGAQLQLGGFGDLIETLCSYVSAGHLLTPEVGERLADIADLLTHIWRCEDSGLWELGERAHYGTSKLGVWVAFERLLSLVAHGHVPPRHVRRWTRARDEVREFIERQLFSPEKNSYLMKAGSDMLDCGMLLAGRRGFGDVRGDRTRGTIEALAHELDAGGPLLFRYTGMRDEENAFLACSFWMVEALALTGRTDEAVTRMEDLLARGSGVGLFSEEMKPDTYAMRGNIPQALTHLSLIQAASTIERTTANGDASRCLTSQAAGRR